MIEIIKPGTKEKISCNSCGCLFSYEKEDIEIGHPHNLYPYTSICSIYLHLHHNNENL